ncbi:hypothetical protein VSH64_22645 [Amycolatopsis rhabdoformis]|uniref:Uncharacterized protein n=1 Tax=Amycolatopsis rhabdoformis TaxID=1448059 RepID=A0ABZ1IKU1_9PSEU|nr:hypothetical protein [Amycolatopsis rhabdoformis]WSE34843.1 hypothetical protein VSH64_22645 [Amycolatopsis rhabdoformis]
MVDAVMHRLVPTQGVEQGTEPLLCAAADPAATNGGYYGPRWGLVGPTKSVRLPRPGRDTAAAARWWTEAERLTEVSVAKLETR